MNYFNRRPPNPWYFDEPYPYRGQQMSLADQMRQVDEDIRALEHFKKTMYKEEKKEEKRHGVVLSMPVIYGMLFFASQLCNILLVVGAIKLLR